MRNGNLAGLILVFLVIVTSPAFASPSISGISGIVAEGNQISIYGSNFGAIGPDIKVFDNFSRGVSGEEVTLTPPVGSWSSGSPTYWEDPDGNISGMLSDTSGSGLGGRLTAIFSQTTEVFLSYRVQIPNGYNFPMAEAPNTFSDGSNWKIAWLFHNDIGGGDDATDIVVPTYPFGRFTVSGNSGRPRAVDNSWSHFDTGGGYSGGSRWFSFNGWNRFSGWLKGGQPDPTADAGKIWAQGMSDEFGQIQFGPSSDYIILSGPGYWTQLNIPGWTRSGSVNHRAAYDDIYLAIGPNAAARVEIGDSEVYSNCTKLSIATSNDWSDTKISANIQEDVFSSSESVYLFVIDSNNIPSEGYGPIQFGSSVELEAPLNLQLSN